MDLLFKKSALTNGGVISGNQYNSPLQFEDLFQSPTAYEMSAGLIDYKKVFAHFSDNAANLWVKRIRPVLIKQTVGDDRILWGFGTRNDTTSNFNVSRWYGAGVLETSITSTATSIRVYVKSVSDALFLPDDVIILDNGTRERTAVISTVSYSGNVAILGLTGQIGADFTFGVTTVAVRPQILEQKATAVKASKISLNGDFDATKVTLNAAGTVSNRFTLTFQSATQFYVTGDDFNLASTGFTTIAFSPNNPATNTPYLTIPTNAWVGVFQSGDQVVIETTGNYNAIWFKRIIPIGASGFADNRFTFRIPFAPEV